jgi:hypothetical protein
MTPTVGAAEAVSGHNATVGLVTPGPLVMNRWVHGSKRQPMRPA